MSRSQLLNHLKALQDEINILKQRIQPHDTGHIHTTINLLEERVVEIETEIQAILDSTE